MLPSKYSEKPACFRGKECGAGFSLGCCDDADDITLALRVNVEQRPLLPAMPALAQSARWEGSVARSNKQKSMLTVRAKASNDEKVICYDSSTRFTSQEHGSKKVKDIDASQVNDGDRVICLGYYDDKGEFRAALISKRLSQ